MAANEPKELSVVLKAKDLCSYVNQITKKIPKEHRYTYTVRLRTLALDVIEELYLANEDYIVGSDDKEMRKDRWQHQHRAMSRVRLLCFFSLMALEDKAILQKQYKMISSLSRDVLNLTGAWLRSDRRRYQYNRPQMQNGQQSLI